MATDPAVPPRDRTHRLWQVPTFLVGLAALYILWHSGDKLRPSVADRYERSLHALRPAVDRWPPDIDRIQAALRKVPTEAPPAELAPQAHYLIGSAFVALAESTTSEAEAAEWWARARQDLEAAADRDLPAQDQKKLRYRLARAWANTGADLNRTIEFLTNYLAAGDDPAEGHRLLADLYLKVTPPNEPKARDSLQNFLRHAPARADARSLNQARVRLAELHAKLNEPEEARKVLDRVGPEAPPELFAAARLMLADHHRADQDWSGATKAWEQVRDMRGATEAQRSEALVRLGEAYAKLNRPGDAAAAVDQAGKAGGPGGRAGAFRTAELKLKDPAGLTAAVAALESAFAGADPAALRRLVPPADAKRVCNEAFEKAKEAGDSSLVLRVANVYAKVSENADHHRLLAEAHEARAKAANPDDAKGHFRSAAEACTAAAAQEATPTGKADWLRKAAGLFVKSGDRAKAMAMLGDLTPRLAEYPEDRVGRAWVEAGEVYLAAGDKEQARLAFRTAAGRPGPDRDRARVRFAALSAETDPAQGSAAVAMLEDVINTPPGDTRDRATHEEAAYLLGELHLVAKQLPEAEVRLRMALDVYPESPRAARGRYQLGQAFRQKAAAEARKIEADRAALAKIKQERVELRQAAYKIDEQSKIEDRIDRSWKAYEEAMRAAYETFRKAEEQLLTVKDADPEVVRRTSFWAADCAHWLGEYADCSARYEKLIGRYKDTVWELDATRNLHRCCRFAAEAAREAKDTDGAARWAKRVGETFAKMKEALARVPATELDGSTELKTKAFWDKWVAENGPRAGIAE
jgi:tetratricopeptide (TPR) repeat protein